MENSSLYLAFVLFVLIGHYMLKLVIDLLNIRHASDELPGEFDGYYDAEKYRKSQEYLRETTRFRLLRGAFFLAVTVVFILAGGFNFVDIWARGFGGGEIVTGLIFGAVLLLAMQMLGIPFSAYKTFVIEEKFGFNRTTVKTFVLDLVKAMVLAAAIGGLVFGAVLWFFLKAGGAAWLYCWIFVVLFELVLTFLAPAVILPLFNKYVPLEEGELRGAIQSYADQQAFRLRGIYKMDGSRRSSKSNAFFTGFGKFKRIALFDTLIERHTVDELVAVLAHEIGHYKKRHIMKSILLSAAVTGVMFFLLKFFLNNPELFAAFRMEQVSVYAGLVFFSFLFTPVNTLFSVASQILSRKNEYEADRFAAETHGKPEAMVEALKKLTVHNLSNLTPHPAKVFFDYTHPPVLERVRAIRKLSV